MSGSGGDRTSGEGSQGAQEEAFERRDEVVVEFEPDAGLLQEIDRCGYLEPTRRVGAAYEAKAFFQGRQHTCADTSSD